MTAAILLITAAVILLVAAVTWRPRQTVRHRPVLSAHVRRPSPPIRPAHRDLPHALYHYKHRLRPGRRYIGIAVDPDVRHKRHLRDPRSKVWLPLSTGAIQVDRWYPNYEEAHAAEIVAIRAAWFAGEDIANTQHIPRTRTKGSSRAARR